MLNDPDPAASPDFEIDFAGITSDRVLMEAIATIQVTKIPALLTVMTTLHDDMVGMAYDEPLRTTCDEMMRDAAIRLGANAMNLMLCTRRLRELQDERRNMPPPPRSGDEEFPF